jgi:hypothetical protein
MKNSKKASKTSKPTANKIADMSPAEFRKALARHGFNEHSVDAVAHLANTTRRKQLAALIAIKEEHEAQMEAATETVNAETEALENEEHNLSIHGEDVSAEIEAAADGTGPAKAKALREAAEANTPVPSEAVDTRSGMQVAADKQLAAENKIKMCPECKIVQIPSRYRICDSCLASRRAAKKAAPVA